MDIVIIFVLCFILLLVSSFKGIFVGYPLFISLILFILLGVRRKFEMKALIKMAYDGGKKSLIILKIFILIGGITASWMAAGTVPAIVYYGMKFLNPHIFVLSAFLISSLVSFLIGTSFGTIGTIGVALMVMARSGDVNASLTAGAVLSGAYFGDRCSPMSSSANLIAHLTDTDIYENIKNMFKTSIVPFLFACILYLVFSLRYPLSHSGNIINTEIVKVFNVNLITILPAAIILIFSFFKVDVKLLMLMSILTACAIAIVLQKVSIIEMTKYLFLGYSIPHENPLKDIIKGGGILSMLKVSIVVFISSGFTGIFESTGMLDVIEALLRKAKGRYDLFGSSILVSIVSAAFGCSQTLAVILTHILIRKTYEENNIAKESFAVDLENTAIVISPMIPWNIAVLVPLTTLGVNLKAIGFAFYLFLIPIINLIYFGFNRKRASI